MNTKAKFTKYIIFITIGFLLTFATTFIVAEYTIDFLYLGDTLIKLGKSKLPNFVKFEPWIISLLIIEIAFFIFYIFIFKKHFSKNYNWYNTFVLIFLITKTIILLISFIFICLLNTFNKIIIKEQIDEVMQVLSSYNKALFLLVSFASMLFIYEFILIIFLIIKEKKQINKTI